MAQKQLELFMGNIGNTNMKLGVIGIEAVGSAISKGFEYIGHEVSDMISKYLRLQ